MNESHFSYFSENAGSVRCDGKQNMGMAFSANLIEHTLHPTIGGQYSCIPSFILVASFCKLTNCIMF